jgi:isopentenyl phosphate kinase
MILIKAGGSAITDKRIDFSIKPNNLERLGTALAGAGEPVILCHGGGSFGHPLAIKYRLSGPITTAAQLTGVSHTNIAMRNLSNIVCEALIVGGCNPFALQTSAIMTARKGIIDAFNTSAVHLVLERGFIPVVYGDVVFDADYGFSIVSGDQIMRRLAATFPGSRAIFLTDVDGLYPCDPRSNPDARPIPEISLDNLGSVEAGETGDVTGGMRGKIEEIRQLQGTVSEVQIVNLAREGALEAALHGENGGTRITL